MKILNCIQLTKEFYFKVVKYAQRQISFKKHAALNHGENLSNFLFTTLAPVTLLLLT